MKIFHVETFVTGFLFIVRKKKKNVMSSFQPIWSQEGEKDN